MPELRRPTTQADIPCPPRRMLGEHRPTFTGDIYRLAMGRMVMILQHPCAAALTSIRARWSPRKHSTASFQLG